MAEVEALRRELLAEPPPLERIADDTADMRRRLSEAKPRQGPWDMRAGAGGMQDVELFAQAVALAEGRPARATLDQLGERAGLGRTYALQRRVRSVSALLAPDGFSPEAVGQGGTAMLLRETGGEEAGALAARIKALRAEAARAIEAGLAAMASA